MKTIKTYNRKRNFDQTKEPIGMKKTSNKKKLKFIVQHHLARKDHYDFRLEWDGVYKSFAVPKGPSFHPNDKRLAIMVEDHPLSYGSFEGTIPKGQYGGGTVMLWDKGYWIPEYDPDFQSTIKFSLQGERLVGKWSLVPMKDDNWLLIKEKDEFVKKVDISKWNTSIKTGKTMDDITMGKKHTKLDIEISHPEKIIFPKGKITKLDIVNYYKKVSKYMMPFLENRLISTVRCPNGVNNEHFFMKHLDPKTKNIGKKIIKDQNEDNKDDYYYIKNEAGLLYEVQMNSYEFHIWGCKQNRINHPDIIVFDLDPDEGLSIKKVREGVKDLKKILDELKLKAYLKTSGGKGYHILIPLQTSSWKNTEKIAKDISQLMVNKWPEKYTINMRKEKRKGKIFIDYFRNKKGATSVCPYSLRLKENCTVSAPIFWSELDKIKPTDITIKNIDERLKKNPWNNFFTNQK